MLRRALASALLSSLLLAGAAAADQGTGYIENEYGVGTCDLDAPVHDDMPSSSDCGHLNAEDYANQAPAGGTD